jgi:tetratricopeptide (TPR) repeat protein
MSIQPGASTLLGRKVEEVFVQSIALKPAERAILLDRECAGDDALRREVESLLDHDGSSERALDEVFRAAALELLSDPLVGERVGAYRIVGELGHGGMGAVYLAVRADDAFSKRVAIKVIKRGMDTNAMLESFFKERQILANLDHPYIARLMDGGSTSGHQPFFVMEYVEGRAIDEFRTAQKLSVEQTCRLFQRVCEAVSYAHRNLVVHRDLKPGNILITADGSPKLLDFGVAKLLSAGPAESSTLTRLAPRPFTPEYASPEQIRGLPVNTSTDVYSLGAVLYELLTGARPHGDPARPSSLNRKVPQDLDNILLMALRTEPERRYSSVEQFGADLGRFLDGQPVLARQDSFGYHAGKYVLRHRFGIATAALVAASLITGTAVAIRAAGQAQAAQRIAEKERALAEEHSRQVDLARESTKREHQVAVREAANARGAQARAEQRLTQLVGLANRTLFDVHSAIERLQGATEARRAIVKTTLDYLKDLARDAPDDDRLRLALAVAYMRVGDVQGNPNIASLGDTAGALESYSRAQGFLAPLPPPSRATMETLETLAELTFTRASVLTTAGQSAEGFRVIQQAAPWTAELGRRRPDSELPATIDQMAMSALQSSHPDEAAKYGRQAIQAYEKLVGRDPNRLETKLDLSATHSILAAIIRPADLQEALIHYHESVRIREELAAQRPDNADFRRKLMIAYGQTANALWDPYSVSLQDAEGAAVYYTKALAMAKQLRQADPVNRVAQYDLAAAELRLAALPAGGKDARALLIDARGLLEPLAKADPKSLRYLRNLSMVYEHLGANFLAEGKQQESLEEYRKSLASSDKVLLAEPDDNITQLQALAALQGIATILAGQGDRGGAIESARDASARAARAPDPSGVLRARGELTMALVELQLGDWAEARQAAVRSAEHWRQVIASHRDSFGAAELDRAQKVLAEADAHLPH